MQASTECRQCSARKPCSVCGERLEQDKFGDSQWRHSIKKSQNWTLRCIACHTCTTCGVEKVPKSFEGNAKQCIQCQRQSDTCRCDACKQMLARDAFDHRVLEHAKLDKRHAVCLRCAERGFSPRDVQPYPCVECGEKGHLKFPRAGLDDYKR